jgi:hypothetical protein
MSSQTDAVHTILSEAITLVYDLRNAVFRALQQVRDCNYYSADIQLVLSLILNGKFR